MPLCNASLEILRAQCSSQDALKACPWTGSWTGCVGRGIGLGPLDGREAGLQCPWRNRWRSSFSALQPVSWGLLPLEAPFFALWADPSQISAACKLWARGESLEQADVTSLSSFGVKITRGFLYLNQPSFIDSANDFKELISFKIGLNFF